MEQIQFFGGKCNEISMAEETTPLIWLQDETNEKLAWFEKYIMPCRETEPHDLIELRNLISKKNAVKVSGIKANVDTIVEHHHNEQANPISQYRASINVMRQDSLSDTTPTVQQTSNDAEAINLHAANLLSVFTQDSTIGLVESGTVLTESDNTHESTNAPRPLYAFILDTLYEIMSLLCRLFEYAFPPESTTTSTPK